MNRTDPRSKLVGGKLPDEGTVYREKSARHLGRGESIVQLFSAELDPLAPARVPWRHRPKGSKKWSGGGFVEGLVFLVYLPVLPFHWLMERFWESLWRGFGLRRLIRGRVWQGGWESDAGRFIRAVRAGYENEHCLLAFTEQRLMVLDQPNILGDEPTRLLGEFARGACKPRTEPHPARHRNRVDVAFRDNSWLAVSVAEDQVAEVKRLLAG